MVYPILHLTNHLVLLCSPPQCTVMVVAFSKLSIFEIIRLFYSYFSSAWLSVLSHHDIIFFLKGCLKGCLTVNSLSKLLCKRNSMNLNSLFLINLFNSPSNQALGCKIFWWFFHVILWQCIFCMIWSLKGHSNLKDTVVIFHYGERRYGSLVLKVFIVHPLVTFPSMTIYSVYN